MRTAAMGTLVTAMLTFALVGCSNGESESGGGSDDRSPSTSEPKLSVEMATSDVLTADPQFATFLELADQTDLLDRLDAEGELTLLIPSTEALAQLDPAVLESLRTDDEARQVLLESHILDERLSYEDLIQSGEVATRGGASLTVAQTGGAVTVGAATVTKHDIETNNAVVHVVDGLVVEPPA